MGIGVCKSNRPEDRIIQRHFLISWVPSEVAPVRYGSLKAEPANSGLLVQHATGQFATVNFKDRLKKKEKHKTMT